MGPGALHGGFPGTADHQEPRASGNSRDRGKASQCPSTFPVPFSTLGQLSSLSTVFKGITGQPMTNFFSRPLGCTWEDLIFSHSLLVVPASPTPLLGRDVMASVGTLILMAPGQTSHCLPLTEAAIYPQVWATQGEVGWALTAVPIRTHLKDLATFPCWKQYLLTPEAKEGLIKPINNLKQQGL